jgi:hypothetical protein
MLSVDLSALRLVKVPDSGPPYDCEIHGADCPALPDPVLPDPVLPDPVAAAATVPARGAGVPGPAGRGRAAGGPDAGRAPGMPGPAGARAAAAWPRQFAQVTVEILAGVRPVRQAVPWTTDNVLTQIRGLMPRFASDRRPKIQRVMATRPAANAVEMTIVAAFGPRTRALALRFEQIAARQAAPGLPPRPARWLCTALETG